MDLMHSPVAIFIYNRPEKVISLLESIKANKDFREFSYYVFSDGPKNKEDFKKIKKCRHLANDFFKKLKCEFHFSKENKGLSYSIINGVTHVLKTNQSVIVLEDDLVLHQHFFNYMNHFLNKFNTNSSVYSINGHMYLNDELLAENNSFFLPCISSWGWGTWAKNWHNFLEFKKDENNLRLNKEENFEFDLNNSYPFSKILKKTTSKKIDSWAILWYLFVFKNRGLNLFPPFTLILNKGLDGSGSNTSIELSQKFNIDYSKILDPESVKIDNQKLSIYRDLISKNLNPPIIKKIMFKILNKIKLVLK